MLHALHVNPKRTWTVVDRVGKNAAHTTANQDRFHDAQSNFPFQVAGGTRAIVGDGK